MTPELLEEIEKASYIKLLTDLQRRDSAKFEKLL